MFNLYVKRESLTKVSSIRVQDIKKYFSSVLMRLVFWQGLLVTVVYHTENNHTKVSGKH